MTRDELIRRLRQVAWENGLGFDVIKSRGKGSHVVVRLGNRRTVVPYSHGRDLKPGTLQSIATDLGVDPAPVRQEDALKLVYPATLTHAEEGGFVVSFRNFPEAHTQGKSESDALDQASDCLEEVLALYIAERRNIPEPSTRRHGERPVAPGSLIGAKTALYIALARSGLSQRELARRMGVDVSHVTRLLDPKHRSRLDQIDLALRALGVRLTLSVDEAA